MRRDIRGFISQTGASTRFFAKAFYLVDNGYCTIQDVDRSLRNDCGYWITFVGPFRFLDLTGIPAYRVVMEELPPELSCSKDIPALVKRVVDSGGRGVANAKGFVGTVRRRHGAGRSDFWNSTMIFAPCP